MKKIYVLFLSAAMMTMVACGGAEEKKKEDKKEGEAEEETEEPAEEEPEVDYSYVLPQIDTTALTNEVEVLAAMDKVIDARLLDDSLSEAVPGYKGYYTEITILYSTVMRKGMEYSATLKTNDAVAFNDKFDAIMNRQYK